MRILHWNNTGNQGMNLSRAQRALGHASDCAITKETPFEFGADVVLPWHRWNPARRLRAFLALAGRYDVVHIHGLPFVALTLGAPVLRRRGTRLVVHGHGTDLTQVAHPARAAELSGQAISRTRRLLGVLALRAARKHAHVFLVSSPNLLAYAPHAVWVRQPLDLDYWKPLDGAPGGRMPDCVRIGHSPSRRLVKGTAAVAEAVDTLVAAGRRVELVLAENLPHHAVKPLIGGTDIFVDQLRVGWYGNAACEAMAMGKPVCAYIRPDLERHLDGCPVVNADAETLADRLLRLADNPAERAERGARGRAYVERHHDARRIAADLVEMYRGV